MSVLLVLILLVLLFVFWPKKPVVELVEPEPIVVGEPTVADRQVAPLVTRVEPTATQVGAETVARTFAERYASFSAESNFANVRDLLPLMTTRLQAEENARVAKAVASSDYYGVSSTLLALQTIDVTETSALIETSLQRVEARGSATNTSKKVETLRMELKFIDGSWLVDKTTWLAS